MDTSITIGDTTIHQDEHGRYSLNDLHRAAGGEGRHQPSNFLRLDTTQGLVREIHSSDLRSAPLEVVNGGPERGTYVCRELVYAYAMWISPAFHLKVIRAFDAMATGNVLAVAITPRLPATYLEALKALVASEEEKERLAAENAAKEAVLAIQAPKVAAHARFMDASGTMSLRDTAKVLGEPEKAFIARLVEDKVLFRLQGSGRLRAYAHLEERGYFTHRAGSSEQTGKAYAQVRVTPTGLDWLSQRYPPSALAVQGALL